MFRHRAVEGCGWSWQLFCADLLVILSLQKAVDYVKAAFKELEHVPITFVASEHPSPNGKLPEVPTSVWAQVVPNLCYLTVKTGHFPLTCQLNPLTATKRKPVVSLSSRTLTGSSANDRLHPIRDLSPSSTTSSVVLLDDFAESDAEENVLFPRAKE